MKPESLETIDALIVERSLAGADECRLFQAFCEALHAHGLPLNRALLIVDTLHPVHEGYAFRWRNDGVEEEAEIAYGRTDAGEGRELWEQSAFFHILQSGKSELRRRFHAGDPADYRNLDVMVSEGCTDYVAFVQRLGEAAVVGDLDGIYYNFATYAPDGFPDAALSVLRRLIPTLTLAVKAASAARIASTLVEVYLGRDAKARVLRGRIARGVAERIQTVLWFSDLRSFTTITDTAAPEEIIPLLNDYSGAAIEAIHEAGGDVLKLIGDGILAIFNFPDDGEAALAAIRAEKAMRRNLAAIDERRRTEGRPVTAVYLALHIGEVFYGNIGSDDRLDFTVVGPSVNEVARIAAMARSVDRLLVASSAFREALPEGKRDCLVSVGRFALRGVGRAQDLFTLDPALRRAGPGTRAGLADFPSHSPRSAAAMSDTNKNRLNDPKLDADLAHVADEEKGDVKPPRLGSAEAPDAADGEVERESVGGNAQRSSVEGVDEAAATRESIRDSTS